MLFFYVATAQTNEHNLNFYGLINKKIFLLDNFFSIFFWMNSNSFIQILKKYFFKFEFGKTIKFFRVGSPLYTKGLIKSEMRYLGLIKSEMINQTKGLIKSEMRYMHGEITIGLVVTFYILNRRSTSSTIISAIANDEVAAGEGALRTWSILFPRLPWPPSKIKSSTSFPSSSRACALTPDGPLK